MLLFDSKRMKEKEKIFFIEFYTNLCIFWICFSQGTSTSVKIGTLETLSKIQVNSRYTFVIIELMFVGFFSK